MSWDLQTNNVTTLESVRVSLMWSGQNVTAVRRSTGDCLIRLVHVSIIIILLLCVSAGVIRITA